MSFKDVKYKCIVLSLSKLDRFVVPIKIFSGMKRPNFFQINPFSMVSRRRQQSPFKWRKGRRPFSTWLPLQTRTLSATSGPGVHVINTFSESKTLRPNQGILKGEVSLYHWPPVWLVWNQLYDSWQFLFLFEKQNNPNQSDRGRFVEQTAHA